VKTDAQFFLVF